MGSHFNVDREQHNTFNEHIHIYMLAANRSLSIKFSIVNEIEIRIEYYSIEYASINLQYASNRLKWGRERSANTIDTGSEEMERVVDEQMKFYIGNRTVCKLHTHINS